MPIMDIAPFFMPVGKSNSAVAQEIKEWLDGFEHGIVEWVLVAQLETQGEIRQKRKPAVEQLKELAMDAAKENKDPWKYGDYHFLFASRVYYWREKEIYLTPGEQLYLFRRLILKDLVHKKQAFYLRNIRKRLGESFLADLKEEGK